jgi:murein DD-endopeptidase MepM/ murein hydrolase activator NlpD
MSKESSSRVGFFPKYLLELIALVGILTACNMPKNRQAEPTVYVTRDLNATPSPEPSKNDENGSHGEEETPVVQSLSTSMSSSVSAATSTAFPFIFPESSPEPELEWRPPPYKAPLALRPEDHYFLTRPIPSGEVNWANPFYRYGNTFFGENSVHTGVDMGADLGTPVLAAGPGEIIWAGYGLYRGSTDLTDPYGLAIAIRHDFGYKDGVLFTIYAHLKTVDVWPGQRVQLGEKIGTVGNTGHSSGPHLHFEVRLGENRYFGTRNPELWMVPPEGWGVLSGRIMDSFGRVLPEQLVQIRSIETDKKLQVWTYAKGTVFADDYYNENFAISDLPAGPYEITVNYVGRNFTAQLYVYPGQTNFFHFRGREGYTIEPTPITPAFSPPVIE